MHDRGPKEGGRGPTGGIGERFVLFPTVAVAILLVVAVVAASIPPASAWARTWWGSVTFALLMLIGYGTAVGVLGARTAVSTRSMRGRWLAPVIATAPVPFVLLLVAPVDNGKLAAGCAAWGVLVLSLLALKRTSARHVPWPLRAAALGAPSWLLAAVGGVYLAASHSPQAVSQWLLPAQIGVAIAGVVVVPAILIVESIDALGGDGWIGRWLAPETNRRAWVALAFKAAATVALILLLVRQGMVLSGWTQSSIVAAIVLLLLALDSFVPFSDLRRGDGLNRRLRVCVTVAMGSIVVFFGGYLLVLAFQRPLTLVGMLVLTAATVAPARLAFRGGRAASVAVAGGLAAWAWASGPTIGLGLSEAPLGYAVPAIVIVFLVVLLAQIFLALRAGQWGFPVLILAIAAGPVTALLTHERAGVVPVNLILLPALGLVIFLGRSSRFKLIDAGEVIRWSLLSLIVIDVTAAASMATGLLQAGVFAVTLLTLGLAPLVLSDRGRPRIRAAGLVCAVFTALVAMVGVGAHLPDPSPGLLDLVDSLSSELFWVIAFPVSAALSAASARRNSHGSPLHG